DTHGKGPFSFGSVSTPTSVGFGVIATIAPASFFPVAGFPCVTFTESAAAFDLRISASSTVSLNQVTFRLVDGSSVGGPSVTVPSASLVSQFGSTVIVGGGNRLLTFPSPFGCALLVPTAVLVADLTLVNPVGQTQNVTVSTGMR